jgi:aspartyl-tRNA(Asn)/glutamyl-tRNA(Gln) amidotransferase subunit A
MAESSWKPIAEIVQDVLSGKATAESLVRKSLKIIKEKQEYKAIISTLEDRALKRAEDIDERVKKGDKVGRLAGVPFIAKDNFLVYGGDTTAASNILKGFKAPYQATAIERLEAEGAICVAKANMDAFGHGSSTENSDFFTTLNPSDKTRVPGGSSGGSAAAVALDMAPFATGTDTGSSIRLPAAFCGVVGIKPTYGLVSRSGVIAMGSSLDCIGPLAKNVEDASLVLDVIAGKDNLDMTMIDRDKKPYTELESGLKGKKIALIEEYLDENTEPGIKQVVQDSLDKFEKAGAKVSKIKIPSLSLSLAVYYILCLAELSSNLSRYDGQRYGYNYKDAKDLDESYTLSRDIGFGEEAKRRIMIGTYVLSSGYYDAYYKKAQVVRTKLINEFREAFNSHDFLVGAVSPSNPFKIGEKAKDPLKMYLSDLYVTGANLAGIPAVSVPAGYSGGLSVGLQILAPQKKDRQLLSAAKAFEGIAV